MKIFTLQKKLKTNNMRKLKRYTLFVLLWLLALAGNSYGQRSIINATTADSLLKSAESNPDGLRSKGLNQLSRYYFSINPDTSIVFAKSALKQARKNGNSTELGYAYKNIGNYHFYMSHSDSAFHYYTLAEIQFRKKNHTEGLLALYNNIGVIHKSMNQTDLALKYFQKVRSLIDKTSTDVSVRAVLYSNLSGLFYLRNQTEEGLEYLDSASILIEKIDDPYLKGVIYNNLGQLFLDIKRYDKALSMLKLSEKQFNPERHRIMYAMNLLNFGAVYEAIYNYSRADKYYQQAHDVYLQTGDSTGIAKVLHHRANLNITRKNFEKAHNQLDEALRIVQENKNDSETANILITKAKALFAQQKYVEAGNFLKSHQQQILKTDRLTVLSAYYKTLQQAQEKLGNHKLALESVKAYYKIHDSVENSRLEANKSILKQELNMSKQLLKDELQASQKKAGQEHQRTLFYVYSLLALLIAVFAAFFIYRQKMVAKVKAYQKSDKEKHAKIVSLENEARDFDKEVEKRIKERTKDYQQQIEKFKKQDYKLKKTLKEVEDANYLKNAFLSNMSHEIRTPLNGIIGFASLLETELSLLENEELYGYANGIQQSGERLLHLLNNIIDISRIEANDLQVSLQDTNVNQIVEKSAELFKFQANDKGLTFNIRLDETPMAYADPDSVSKILSDIIDNAVKYTEKGFVNITNGYDPDKKEVFVKVRDTGIGIDDNYIPKLFEAFRQESLGYSRAFQGAGLGLPLAKRLLDLLNGRIDVKSQKKEGTTVTVFLPTKETFKHVDESFRKKGGGGPEVALKKAVDKTKVFLVEDDRMNRLVITKMLSDWDLDSAEDGDITIKKIDQAYKEGTIYDLMLFDINLPNPWDGIKLMHHIKKKYPEYQEIPFIAQTAYAMRGDKERLLEEGFDDYLSKPISQQRLLTSMYKFLSKEDE